MIEMSNRSVAVDTKGDLKKGCEINKISFYFILYKIMKL